MNFSIKQISFEDVYPIWREKLWPGRQDPIRPMSSMVLGGGYDMSIYKNFAPVFVGIYANDQLVGVLSGHGTTQEDFRIRGLYVEPAFRRKGGALLMMEYLRKYATSCGFQNVWSFPRMSALSAYEKFGFRIHSQAEGDPEHAYVFLKAVM